MEPQTSTDNDQPPVITLTSPMDVIHLIFSKIIKYNSMCLTIETHSNIMKNSHALVEDVGSVSNEIYGAIVDNTRMITIDDPSRQTELGMYSCVNIVGDGVDLDLDMRKTDEKIGVKWKTTNDCNHNLGCSWVGFPFDHLDSLEGKIPSFDVSNVDFRKKYAAGDPEFETFIRYIQTLMI